MMIYSIQISVIKPCPRSLFIRYLKIFTIYIFIRINSENSTEVSKYIVRIRSGSVLKQKLYITSLYEPRIYSKGPQKQFKIIYSPFRTTFEKFDFLGLGRVRTDGVSSLSQGQFFKCLG